MTADEYQEIRDEIDSLMRVYPLADDPRLLAVVKDAREIADTRFKDAPKGQR